MKRFYIEAASWPILAFVHADLGLHVRGVKTISKTSRRFLEGFELDDSPQSFSILSDLMLEFYEELK